MKKWAAYSSSLGIIAVFACVFWGGCDFSRIAGLTRRSDTPSRPAIDLARLPTIFEPNRGQAGGNALFLSRGHGYAAYFTPTGLVLGLKAGGKGSDALALHWVGARASEIRGEIPSGGHSHYLTGADPGKWIRDVGHFGRIRYANLYPGIDLVFYGNQGRMEYDYVVDRGADLGRIAIEIKGARDIRINKSGDLVLTMGEGELVQRAPKIYQEREGRREPIAGRYVLKSSGRIGFEVASYDESRSLVIDPILEFSTYFGGQGGQDNYGKVALDREGNVYVSGTTTDGAYPVQNPYQSARAGGPEVFVAKFSPSGTLIYSTLLGGSGDDYGTGIAVDGDGNVFVSGETNSRDFPALNPYQAALNCPANQAICPTDAFFAKLNAAGNGLAYSTYFGGREADTAYSIAVDPQGNLYAAGTTVSVDFPTRNAYQDVIVGSPFYDAFVCKLTSTGALDYSTYLGGSSRDEAMDIDVDAAGNAYVTGETFSTDFPVLNPFQAAISPNPLLQYSDAFFAKLNSAGVVGYASYLGGSRRDMGMGIKADANGNVYLTGHTQSADFPVSAPYQAALNGNSDAFVTKVNAAGNTLQYSTYLGGASSESGIAVSADRNGQAIITGSTESGDFPLKYAFQNSRQGDRDAFIIRLTASGGALQYGSYLGGSSIENTYDLAANGDGLAYVYGLTVSSDFPVVNAYQASLGGSEDMFLAKVSACTSPMPASANPCQYYECNHLNGQWALSSKPAGTPCENGNLCDGNEVCDALGACQAGAPLPTNDRNPCTVDGCTAAGGVYHLSAANGTACSDGNACTTGDRCFRDSPAATSQCSGTPVNVNDNNPCTADNCNMATGLVSHLPRANGSSCADSVFCNGAEVCQSGRCVAGSPPQPGPCQTADCSEALKGFPPKADRSSCNDGQPPGGDCCKSGMCLPGDNLHCGLPD